MVERTPRNWKGVLLIGIVVLYAALLLLAPMAAILSSLFRDGIEPVIRAISHPDIAKTLQLTFLIAFGATAINTLLGIAIAWVLVRHHFSGRDFFNALVDLPFVMPPVIIGFVVIVLFGRTGWLQDLPIRIAFSPPGILIVTAFVTLPFVIREVMPILASLTSEEEEAAVTLGASRFTVFRRIIIPAIQHGIIYGIVLTTARSLGEFGAAAVAGGSLQGVTETATIYIYRAIHDRNNTGAYSMALILGLISVVLLIVMNALRSRVATKDYSNVNPAE